MSIEIGTAYLSILPSTSKLAAAVRAELGAVEKDSTQAGDRAGKGFASRFASSAGALLGSALKTGAFAAVASGGLLLGAGLKTAADLEQAKIGFETMLGSAGKAESMMQQIQDTAANTPFELPGLTQSAQKMLAFGFAAKDVIPTLTTLGDAAAGLGAGQEGLDQISLAVGQMQAKGKVQSDELLQLTEAGIPALKILANQYGVTAAQMQEDVTAGTVTAQKAIPALLDGIKNGSHGLAGETAKFGGLMAKQSQSLSGLFSTVKDTILVGVAQRLEPLIPTIKTGLAGAIKVLPGVLDSVSDALQTGYTYGRQFISALGDSKAFGNLVTTAKNVAGGVKSLATGFRDSSGAGGALRTALTGIVTGLGAVVTVGTGVTAFLSQHKTLVVALAATFLALRGAVIAFNVAQAAAKAGGLAIYIGQLLAKIPLVAALTKTYAAVQWVLNAAMSANPIGLVVIAIAALVAGFIIAWKNSETFRTIVLASWDAIKSASSAVWGFVTSLVGKAFSILKGYFLNFTGPGLIIKHWNTIKAATSAAWGAIKSAVSSAWNAIKSAVSSGVNAVKSVIGGISSVVGVVSNAFERAKNAISNKIGDAVNVVKGLPGRITGAIGDLGSLLYNAGVSVISGLIRGVEAKAGELMAKLKSITNKIPDWKGPADRDKVLLEPAGRLLMDGLSKGVEEGAKSTVMPTLGRVTADVAKATGDAVKKSAEATKKAAARAKYLKELPHILRSNGRALVGGLIKGIDDQKTNLQKIVKGLLSKDFPKGKIKAVLKGVGDEYDRGLDWIGKLKKKTADLDQANADLKTAIDTRDQYHSAVAGAASDWARALDFDSAKPIDTQALVKQMQDRLAAVQTFRQNMASLLAMGIDPTTYKALVDKGVEAGGALAAALVKDPAAVTAISDLGSQIDKASDGLGKSASDSLYQAGVDSAQSIVDGLKIDKDNLQAKADKIARQIAKAIKDALNLQLSAEDLTPGDTSGGGKKGGNGGKKGGKKGGAKGSGAFDVKVYDSGGVLEPGTLAYNASRKPEAVFNQRQFAQFATDLKGSGAPVVEKHLHYYAAQNHSLPEEDLFAAANRARMNGF